MKTFLRPFAFSSICMAVLAGLSVSAQATEHYNLRYAPGIGGADMSAPVDPGMYLQVPLFVYHATLDNTTTTVTPMADVINSAYLAGTFGAVGSPGALAARSGLLAAYGSSSASTNVATKLTVDIRALLPRFTYMSTNQLLGATVGFTALLPLMEQKSALAVGNIATTVPAGPNQAALAAGVNSHAASLAATEAASATGRKFGIGDLEVAPVFRWNRDPDQIVFVPTVILPTGKYDAARAANPGAGKFYTFRPSIQYSHIGDGWDLGTRFSYSINTRNKDTDYKSGNYVNIDFALMKSLSDAFRVGVQGYMVYQVTRDSKDGTPSALEQATLDAGKGHVTAIGPSIAWIKGAGEMLVEGKIMKEFAAKDRPEGTALWLQVAMPIQ